MNKKYIVGITGASGSVYAKKLLKMLGTVNSEIFLMISPSGVKVIKHELGVSIQPPGSKSGKSSLKEFLDGDKVVEKIRFVGHKDFFSGPASGSFIADAMVICPCSMGTLARVRHGFSTNLLERAADVTIKERRKLILLTREMPFSPIHLENMLALSKIGVSILPASPGFYNKPKTIEDLTDFVTCRIADQLGIANSILPRWEERTPSYLD